MKVLIAEDDPISAAVLRSYLEKWGHEVVAAEDGAEAWRRFEADQIALVITDWMMPEADGLELIRRIRASRRPGYVYVILLTAKSDKQDLIEGMETGADDFLAKPFDRDELRVRLRAGERVVRLEQDLARRNDELRAANVRMKHDLEAAARVQRALLPAALPEYARAHFAWQFKPCEELAGDLLGAFRLDQDHAGLYVLDVSGHGVAAALLSVSVSRFLAPAPSATSLLWRPGPSGFQLVPPAEVAVRLNRRFPMDPATGQYFTFLYGVLDLRACEFRYASAGHPGPVYLPRDGAPELRKVRGFPIGITDEPGYEEHAVALRPGDRLYLYSDGIPEAAGPDGKQLGPERFLAALAAGRRRPLADSLADLLAAVEAWGGGPLHDDVSVLAVEAVP